MTVQHKINVLRKELNHHNELYYNESKTEITDRAFDKMLKDLIELENEHPELITPDSPTQRVGGDPIDGFVTVSHDTPMLSIENTYNRDDVDKFNETVVKSSGITDPEYLVEMKIDGCSISLLYEDGILIRGATRGDGKQGDDVTHNIKVIQDVPLKINLSGRHEFRGEIYMKYDTFDKINETREAAGEDLLKNPRNAASGALKRKSPRESAKSKLSAFMYGYDGPLTEKIKSQKELLTILDALGFKVEPNYVLCKGSELEATINKFDTLRTTLNYPTDGAVIKLNSIKDRIKLGTTSKHPKWLVAYKFAAETALTKITLIDFQVGKSGIITPVCYFEPTELCGTTIQKATLCNFDYLDKIDIRMGDTVEVQKAGEIIPQILRYIPSKRIKDSVKVTAPDTCPDCKATVVQYGETVFVKCSNEDCPSVLKGKIEYFAGRDTMNIEGLGEKVIEQIVDIGLVNCVADLFLLTVGDLESLERMGEKSAKKIVDNIANSTSVPFEKVLAGISIPGTGRSMSRTLARHFKNIDNIIAATKEELMEVENIGSKVADGIIEYLRRSDIRNLIATLKSKNIQLEVIEQTSSSSPLKGMTIVITGSLTGYNRDDAQLLVLNNGGKPSSAISKNTTYLVTGDNPGKGKVDKAAQLGVKVITQEELLELISV